MNLKLLKGYVFLVICILLLAAAAILLVTNLDNDWRLKVYWRDRMLPRAAWLLLAAAGGLVIWWAVRKLLPAGIAAVRQGGAAQRTKEAEKRLSKLEKGPQQRP
jgi:hypothetical protein